MKRVYSVISNKYDRINIVKISDPDVPYNSSVII